MWFQDMVYIDYQIVQEEATEQNLWALGRHGGDKD